MKSSQYLARVTTQTSRCSTTKTQEECTVGESDKKATRKGERGVPPHLRRAHIVSYGITTPLKYAYVFLKGGTCVVFIVLTLELVAYTGTRVTTRATGPGICVAFRHAHTAVTRISIFAGRVSMEQYVLVSQQAMRMSRKHGRSHAHLRQQ